MPPDGKRVERTKVGKTSKMSKSEARRKDRIS
jgi:hypothetical protein